MTLGRRIAIAGLAGAAALALASCTGGGDDAPETAETPAEELTCEAILRPSFVTELTDLGWSARQDPFRVGEHELKGGVQCVWGDYEHGTDIAQMYGWAPVSAEQSTELQTYLEDNGWLKEEEGDYVYLTENPEIVSYIPEGEYGMTYQFADGWVAMADTKQGLDLITWRG